MNTFEKKIIDVYGKQGKEWLAELPNLTATVAKKYELKDLQPITNMNFNRVFAGYQNEKPIILKLGLNHKALSKEAKSLKAFSQHGAARVLASDHGMIIMQRAIPGTTLKDYFPDNEQQATTILCQRIQQLHQAKIPKQHSFYPLKQLLSNLDNTTGIPTDVLAKARQLRDDLLASTHHIVLLHGDLHHENIVKHGDEWLVIDPMGYIGDPVFEVCAFICNPIPELLDHRNSTAIIHQRIQYCFKHLGYSMQRIYDWLYVISISCWARCLDDNIDPSHFKQLVRLLDRGDYHYE